MIFSGDCLVPGCDRRSLTGHWNFSPFLIGDTEIHLEMVGMFQLGYYPKDPEPSRSNRIEGSNPIRKE